MHHHSSRYKYEILFQFLLHTRAKVNPKFEIPFRSKPYYHNGNRFKLRSKKKIKNNLISQSNGSPRYIIAFPLNCRSKRLDKATVLQKRWEWSVIVVQMKIKSRIFLFEMKTLRMLLYVYTCIIIIIVSRRKNRFSINCS